MPDKEKNKVNDINTVGRKKSFKERIMTYSMFGLRFGVYIENSIMYVGPMAVIFTLISAFLLLYVVIVKMALLGKVEFCCNFVMLYFKNISDSDLD